MTLEHWYFVSQITAAFFVVASIVFLAMSVRQNSRIIERSMTEDHRTAWQWTYDEVVKSREFAEFHKKIGENWHALDDVDHYRAEWLAMKNIQGMLRSVQARLDGYVSESEWQFLKSRISRFGNRKNMQIAWGRLKNDYPKQVQDIWEDLSGNKGI